MALYIGGQKRKITTKNGVVILKSNVIKNKLKSFDEYLLKDNNNLFLTVKEEDIK